MQNGLTNYFNFDSADLDANRNGLLSPAQNARLTSTTRNLSLVFSFTLSLAGGLVLGLLLSLLILPLWLWSREHTNWGNVLWIIPCSLPVLFFVFLSSRTLKNINTPGFRIRRAAGQIRVAQVEEEFEIHDKRGKTGVEIRACYEINVGDVKFITYDPDLENLMRQEEGEIYAVYYLSSTTDSETEKVMDAETIKSLEKISRGG